MPTFESLKKEIDSLKEQLEKINQWVFSVNKNQTELNERISILEKGSNFVVDKKVELPEVKQLPIIPPIIPAPPKKPEEKQASFEEDIGMKWFARIGILTLVIGIGFFIKYAIDMDWINHLTRIIMGVVFGISLIIFGEIVSKKEKYINWAKTLVGGGFAIIYFAIYAAYHFKVYQIAIGISQTLDIILLSLVVIFAIFFSLKDNSQIIAAESFFLGYVTSLLSNNFELMTIIYSLLLTVGLVIIVSYKKWSVIGFGGVIISYFVYLFWNADNSNSFAYSTFILISYFVAFTIQSFFLVKRKDIFKQNIIMILINSFLFFLLYYFQIQNYYPDYTGFFVLIFSIFNFAGYYIFQNLKEEKFAITYLYLALLFFTLTIPIQLNKELITVVWALETLFLTMMFLKTKINALKIGSYIIGIIVMVKTLVYDSNMLNELDLANLLNSTRLFSFLVTIICFFVIYKLLKNKKELLPKDDTIMSLFYSWAASGFLVFIIFLELNEKYSVWVSIILSILALTYILLSKIEIKEIRDQSIAISIILFSKILLYDSWNLSNFNINNLFSSTRFLAFFAGILAFYIIGWHLENKKDKLVGSEFILTNIYSYAGTILAFILIMIEAKEFWISVEWSILALIIIISGFTLGKKYLRIQGIIIFAITIFKVAIYDTSNLETIYRTILYIALGIILLLVSFIYTKYKEKLKEIL